MRAAPLGPEVAELHSCLPTETSLVGDPKDFNESVFTHYLIMGLSGDPDAEEAASGNVTFDSLMQYVQYSVHAYAAEMNDVQTPDGRATLGGMVLAHYNPPPVKSTPPVVTDIPTSARVTISCAVPGATALIDGQPNNPGTAVNVDLGAEHRKTIAIYVSARGYYTEAKKVALSPGAVATVFFSLITAPKTTMLPQVAVQPSALPQSAGPGNSPSPTSALVPTSAPHVIPAGLTLRQAIDLIEQHGTVLLAVLLFPPLAALLTRALHAPQVGKERPWRNIYSTLVYLTCIPGVFSATLAAYSFFFRNENLLDVNVLAYVAPVVSMVLTLSIIHRTVAFDDLPGFQRLEGLVCLMALSFITAFFLQRVQFIVLFHGGGLAGMIVIAALIFMGLKVSWHAITRPRV